MVSSDAETGIGDCCVGTIVWVRRRNGSWWPGKILGPDELSASHLMSPRSGTPVKLLGREDASVDWYNLEKSKRVKPFRCGEFDDCIERAEASQGMPPKKREKYARREDAILHALELEKQMLEKKYGKLGVSSNGLNTKLLQGVGKDTTAPPEFSSDNAKYAASKMDPPSLEDKRKGHSLQAQRVEGVDGKNSYVRPRMRGLQDLSIGPVLSKYKLSSLPDSNGSHTRAPDDGIHADLNGLTPENITPSSGQNLSKKRKRSQERHLEEAPGKRRDKHRPLVKVLESTAKSPVDNSLQLQDDGSSAPHLIVGKEQRELTCPSKAGNDAGTTVKSDQSFDYTETLSDQVENSTPLSERRDNTFPFGLSEENTAEDTETDSSGTESLISDTYDAMTTLSDDAEHIELIPKSFGRYEARGENESMSDDNGESLLSSVTFSKWQLKGKRNSRTNAGEKRVSMGSSHWLNFRGEDVDRSIRGFESCHDSVNWEDLTQNEEPFALERYWEQSDPVPVYGTGRLKSMLIDVEVQVQSGYQREHVPMISLMSKLYDKAIVGHPIPIETLESHAAADELQMESSGYDTMLQPWSTARRTAKCRVPRVSALDEEEEEQLQHEYAADEERKPIRKGNPSKKCYSAKLPKRPHRRSGLSSSQKIRMLSSIGGSEQQSSDLKAEGVIKPESLATAAVACIPVKLVFSRLHEELVARHQ